ncbi:MAG: NAD(P)/FAD-dependent oxidoreductase [Candidatus Woesearchaeota archaeon]|nr:MAG: NAD(P)/FAD-dependent oxidoreductase [Candidatus Woesearchaeota archaeon]
MKYDVLVIGAGPAGTIAASNLAGSGLETLLVDAKPKEEIGKKVCGNALGGQHLETIGIPDLPDYTYYQRVKGIRLYSPNLKASLNLELEGTHGYMLDRKEFGSYLLNRARNQGAEFLDNHKAEISLSSGIVVGGKKIKADMTLVASGMSNFSRNIKELSSFQTDKNKETVIAFRQILKLKPKDMDTKYLMIHLNQEIAPVGYCWTFPMYETDDSVVANVGIGMAKQENPMIKQRLENYKELLPDIFSGSEVLESGGGEVPISHPQETLVGLDKHLKPNGILLAGDAGNTVSPIHDGGIGSSMKAGKAAAEAMILTHETGELDNLFTYNSGYLDAYGYKQVKQLMLMKQIRKSNNHEIDAAMCGGIIKDEDIEKISMGQELKIPTFDKIRRGVRAKFRKDGIFAAKKLLKANRLVKEITELYEEYPAAPVALPYWISKLDNLLERA